MQSYTGIIKRIASFDVTFLSECFEVKPRYDNLVDKSTFWTWTTEDEFTKGY